MGTDKKKGELFVEYSSPNNDGISKWMDVKNLPDEFKSLYSNNGYSWCREASQLNEDFIVKKERGKIPGRPVVKVKLDGKRKK